MMDVIEAIHARRSIRSYEARAVKRAMVEDIIADAAQAPPPFRGQAPCAFHVIQGAERIAGQDARAMQFARERARTGQNLMAVGARVGAVAVASVGRCASVAVTRSHRRCNNKRRISR